MEKKNIYHAMIFLTAIFCSLNQVQSQSSSYFIPNAAPGANMPFAAGDYLGWAAGVGIPVSIRHNGGLNIDFYNGPAPANQTMTILGANGNVGIGTPTPAAVLHLNRNNIAPTVPVTTLYSNPNANAAAGGFDVGIDAAGVGMIRHFVDEPIEIWTVGLPNPPLAIRRNAAFTSNITMENGNATTEGDGLRIYDPYGTTGNLDLWTSDANVTNVKWGPNGSIRGIHNRFEIQGEFTQGLWFNVQSPCIRTFFNSQGTENARIGANTFWRIGPNPSNVDPSYTLDVNGHAAIRQVSPGSTLPHVLVVDDVSGSGEIQYRDISSFGNVTACTGGGVTQDFITKWTSTTPPTVCKSIIYEDPVTPRIGISNTSPNAKLDVQNSVTTIGIKSSSFTSPNAANAGVLAQAANGSIANLGIIGLATYPPTNASAAQVNGVTALKFNVGVEGVGEGSTYNFGGIFEANGCIGENFGIYASARKICTTQGGIAGYFNGDIVVTGSNPSTSDIKLKDSIQNLTGALSIISRLHPKNYVFKTDTFPYMNLSQGAQHGLIAQQVDTVLPELVHEVMQPQIRDTSGAILQDTMTFKTLDYTSLIPITIRAIQELDSLQNTKLTSCTGTAPPAANNLTKWDSASNVLCTSVIYDDGNRIGIPVTDAGSYVNVLSHNDAATASFASDDSVNTVAVVKALYDANGNTNVVSAVSGYSKYVNDRSYDDGIGGSFEGGANGVYGLASGAIDEPAGVTGQCKNATDVNRGVFGLAVNYSPYNNAGVFGTADSADNICVGVVGLANGLYSGAHKAGVLGFASGSTNENFGGRFETDDTVGINYAVYGFANGSAPDAYAGYFDGDVHATGTVTWTSDANLKTNVRDINSNDALASVLRLEPKTYEYRKADYPYLNLASGNQYGLLAQDVQLVLPELVSDITQPERRDLHGNIQSPKLEYKGLNYVGIIPVLIGAVKELKGENDSLKQVINDRLNAIDERLNNCCHAEGSRKTDDSEGSTTAPPANEKGTQVNHMTVELSSMQVIVLEQNVPNPFAEQTSISYFVPENMTNAQIIFTDMLGTVIKTADIKTGYGVMTVFASNLSTGQYSYTLLVDGKTIETKKMVKSK